MKFVTHPHRHADVILSEPEFAYQYAEVLDILRNVTDEDLIQRQEQYIEKYEKRAPKSLSVAINEILKERFIEAGWNAESAIFQDENYQGKRWRLDFAKDDISIEVAFNHGEAIAWNLTKPVLASELNHVKKEIQTKVGIIIAATEEMKTAGGFDSAVGTFEKFQGYLPPLRNLLTAPILLIGLLPPEKFYIQHSINERRKKYGVITHYD